MSRSPRGSFSAASNVTGIISDDVAITTLLHRHGALSLWDYAAAGPYLRIQMNPRGEGIDERLASKDAIVVSPHKFIGGPGTPGVLVVKKHVCQGRIPTMPGGGTVLWVSPSIVRYLDDVVMREEAGTPAIIESIRAGLVFQLKEAVGPETIRAREEVFVTRAIASFQENDRLWVLGNPELDRLSIVSLLFRHGRRLLHWNYVVTLLKDVSYLGGELDFRHMRAVEPESALPRYLEEARQVFAAAASFDPLVLHDAAPRPPEGFESMRWFLTPIEAARDLRVLP